MALSGPFGTSQHSAPGGGTQIQQWMQPYLDPDVKAQTDVQRYGLDLRQDRFNRILPMLSGIGSGSALTNMHQIGGMPTIDTNRIWNPQQQQQAVNSQRATNDMATQTQQRLAQQSVAGRGFGANSPLALAMQNQLAGQNLATNADTERQTRMGMTQANASHRLGAQTAWEAAYSDRLKPYLSYQAQTQNALLSALAGLAS